MASRFQDLECWQLARDVSRVIFAMTASGKSAADYRFRDQIRDSASSAPRNIAEGFGRFRPAEFANKLRIALGELNETESMLLEGRDRQYFEQADVEQLQGLIRRAVMVTSKLRGYLEAAAKRKKPPCKDDDSGHGER